MQQMLIERLRLKNRKMISIPEIQFEQGCSYHEACSYMSMLFVNELAASTVINGIYYPLNHKTINPRTLDDSEVHRVTKYISVSGIYILDTLSKAGGSCDLDELNKSFRYTSDDISEALKSLVEWGVIHEFCGKYYLSVCDTSVKQLRGTVLSAPDDMILSIVAFPIFASCCKSRYYPSELIETGFMPEKSSSYLKKHLPTAIREHRVVLDVIPYKHKNVSILKYEIIEAFLSGYDFETKEEYVEEARRSLAIIKDSEHCSEQFVRSSEEAFEELVNDLTLDNIIEIKRIIAGRSHFGYDDEDGDDDN